jgi:trehalose synthase
LYHSGSKNGHASGGLGLHRIEDYAALIGNEAVGRIKSKAARLSNISIVHVSSTFYGGGVAELLTPLTLLMNATGVKTGWQIIQGTLDFFNCTKKIHNALQGARGEIFTTERELFERVVHENAMRLHLDGYDIVAVHDPQPLPLIRHRTTDAAAWVWRAHIDLSLPNPSTWNYLRRIIEQYDTAVFSLPEYAQDLAIPQRFFMPAINPFSEKNRELSDAEVLAARLGRGLPGDRPLIIQVSRFDKWKDPLGVIQAFQLARQKVDCVLALVGNGAVDDPEGAAVLQAIQAVQDDNIFLVPGDDPILVNALQRSADVVLQKSLREGFGLTVTEAMWKGAAVVGGNVGGIRHQIIDGQNGFLVNNVEETADRIVALVENPALRRSLGARARQTVQEKFLLSRLMEDWLDLGADLVAPRSGASSTFGKKRKPEVLRPL